jgi:UDP-N-acetylmuramate dehydrogenase
MQGNIVIKINYPLQTYNTFGIATFTSYFTEILSEEQVPDLILEPVYQQNDSLILGGGSNILFTKDFKGLVIHVKTRGIRVIDEDKKTVVVSVGGGVLWDEFVSYAVNNNWGGIENLSAIPGTVGAAPVQNIGAYGAEIKDVIEKIEGFDLNSNEFHSFNRNECHFQYRNSIFKREYLNTFLICRVIFRLNKPPHRLIMHYGSLAEDMDRQPEKNIASLRKLIIRIRESKLPDYRVQGNAGSFFKNPEISNELASALKSTIPDMPLFTGEGGHIKLSAAWLIEKSGCKETRIGNAGIHPTQPLVLINLGNATGKELLDLSVYIQEMVKKRFGIVLEPEVNII